jgi:succinate-semialdehyde dehydrogenase/glutarate-semialdehyde dehydrogenase
MPRPASDGDSGLPIPPRSAPLGELEIDTAEQVRAAVERARKAQVEWSALGFRVRAHYLDRAARLLATRADEFAERIAAETGKPRFDLLTTEILTGCDSLQFYAKRARHILADRSVPLHLLKTKKLRISHHPLGVVGSSRRGTSRSSSR